MAKAEISLVLISKIEQSRGPQYSIKYCHASPSYYNYFGVISKNTSSIYRTDHDSDQVTLVKSYVDEDLNEELFICTWGCHPISGYPILYTGGLRGVIKGANCITNNVDVLLRGHGNSINDMKVHPIDDRLLFSASKDESIRLWNILTSKCIAIFAGEHGHRLDVLTIDIHPLGNCFVSAGMDTAIRIWNLGQTSILLCMTLTLS